MFLLGEVIYQAPIVWVRRFSFVCWFVVTWHSGMPIPNCIESHVTETYQLISIRIFHIYCPVWLKFSTRHLRVMLVKFIEFCENRLREGRAFSPASIK
jgi:hypothetical protein